MIAITVPVKNRAWALPEFFTALEALQYPKSDIALLLVDDGSTLDNSAEILQSFAERHVQDYGLVRYWQFSSDAVTTHTSSRDAKDRAACLVHLAWVRNFLLDAVTILRCDAQFSVDSDIFVQPDTLARLLAHEVPYVAPLVVNDNHGGDRYTEWSRRRGNIAVHQGGGFVHDTTYPLHSLVESGMSGACYLARYDALYSGARYATHPFGEDAGYALQLQQRGIPIYVDTTPGQAWHCMAPEHLSTVLAAREEANHGNGQCMASLVGESGA